MGCSEKCGPVLVLSYITAPKMMWGYRSGTLILETRHMHLQGLTESCEMPLRDSCPEGVLRAYDTDLRPGVYRVALKELLHK